MIYCRKFLCLIVLSVFLKIHSQNNSNDNIYQWFDNQTGNSNNGLYNGTKYKNQYRTLKGNHQYLEKFNFQNGYICYNGQPYYNTKVKYDIYNDELIAKIPSKSAFIVLKLVKDKITDFKIGGREFIALKSKRSNKEPKNKNFFEILYKGDNISLLQKHYKDKKEKLDKKIKYNEFTYKTNYLIVSNGKHSFIKSKKDIIRLFPDFKKEINRFFGKNSNIRKSTKRIFLKQLVNYINSLQLDSSK